MPTMQCHSRLTQNEAHLQKKNVRKHATRFIETASFDEHPANGRFVYPRANK